MKQRISIHIATKDRFSELGLLLESLRHQTHQEFDLIIYDTSQPAPATTSYFINAIVSRIKQEGHGIIYKWGAPNGVCDARNKCIEFDFFKNPLILRCDDDVILEPKYIEKLLKGINKGYDLMSGVVPSFQMPEWIRETKKLGKIINEHTFDSEGNIISRKDECAFCYDAEKLIPTHHFRTMALYKKHKDLKYPTHLSPVGFREEGFFSFKAILLGYKLGVNTGARAYHLQTPSGGCRYPNYALLVQQDDEEYQKWIKNKFKEHGNFILVYNKRVLK